MKRRKLCLLVAASALGGFSASAMAQMDHSNMPGMKMPAPAKKNPAAKKTATTKSTAKTATGAKPAAKKTAVAKTNLGTKASATKAERAARSQPQSTCLPEHAAMGHCTPPAAPATPQPKATCLPEHAAMGHCTAAATSAPKATSTPEGTDLPAGSAPPPQLPSDHAADRVYDPAAMAMGRHHLGTFHGNQKLFQMLTNVMEYQVRKGRNGYEWDSEAWYGGDIKRLWLKSEGEGASGVIERIEAQALYSHAIDAYFNLQGGVRYDFKPNPSRVYATVGIEGLAPSFFEVEGALFLSNKGEVMARAEGNYDQRITQRLILQPRAELNFAGQSSRSIGVGSGLSDAEIGLRLRYDIRREFSPYIGVQYQRAFGKTRRYLRDDGERAGGWEFVMGMRTWF